MQGLHRSQLHIVVVDPCPQDYRDLALAAGTHGWHVHLLTSARAAIRFSRLTQADLWMISIGLPEISGFDLLEMLRPKLAGSRVLLVADHYNPEQEAHACRCGAALYLCKGSGRSIDCSAILDLMIVNGHPHADTEPISEPELLLESPNNGEKA